MAACWGGGDSTKMYSSVGILLVLVRTGSLPSRCVRGGVRGEERNYIFCSRTFEKYAIEIFNARRATEVSVCTEFLL